MAADTAEVVRAVDGIGDVTQRAIVDDIELALFTLRHEYDFPPGERIISTSTLRFRIEQGEPDGTGACGVLRDRCPRRFRPARPRKRLHRADAR